MTNTRKCFECGDTGHYAADCPNRAIAADGRPPWCGICDEQTRLLGLDTATRCPECHPLKRQNLKQHRKCPRCHHTIYVFDTTSECGHHRGPGTTDRRPPRDRINAIIETAGTQ